jgi:excisionase family DNA binding protein
MQERPPGSYVHGQDGLVVVLPGRIAALLDERAGLNRFRIAVRGSDQQLDAVLLALHVAALGWRTSATGTPDEVRAEPAASWLSTTEAAARVGVTSRAIRRAIAEKRIAATRIGRSWRIARTDLEHYRANRPH